jgi:hypothetical protein
MDVVQRPSSSTTTTVTTTSSSLLLLLFLLLLLLHLLLLRASHWAVNLSCKQDMAEGRRCLAPGASREGGKDVRGDCR